MTLTRAHRAGNPKPTDGPTLSIPILNYHCICDDPPPWIAEYTVTPANFHRHLDVIASSGRTVLTVRQLAEALTDDRPLPNRPLVLTFDDGFGDFADIAAPALAARGLPSTLYVVTGALQGRSLRETVLPSYPMLHWAQLPELEEQGVEIGSHSFTHRELDVAAPAIAAYEVRASKELLEGFLGHEVQTFAYPYGFSNSSVRKLVRASGYTCACAVRDRFSGPGDDSFALARLALHARTTVDQVAAWLAGREARSISNRPETLAGYGWRAYRRVRGLRTFPETGLPAPHQQVDATPT